MKRLIAFVCLFILNISISHAAVFIHVVESGGDVVATTSGSINTGSFLVAPDSASLIGGFVRGSGFIVPGTDGAIAVGLAGGFVDVYTVNTGIAFSTGGFVLATTSSGDSVGISSRTGVADGISLPQAYVSDTELSGTSIWAGHTFTSLGLIPGTYVVRWFNGSESDWLTLHIGPASPTTYTYTGVNYTFVEAGYTTAMKVDATITTSIPIPAGIGDYNIIPIVTSFSATDGLQTISSATGGRFDPRNGTNFDTFANGDIRASYFPATDPIPVVVGDTANYIQHSSSFGDWAAIGIECITADARGCTQLGRLTPTPFGQTSGWGTWAIAATPIPTYSVGGTVTGLTSSVTLQNNGGDTLAVNADGGFTFATELADSAAYAVSVLAQSTGQTCTVSSGSGNIATVDVTNVAVACVNDGVIPPPITPVTSYTGTLPSGATGTLSFTSTDAVCTFATPPQFLDTVTPAPQASISLVDGAISFTVSGCTPGATVRLTMDYGVALPVGSNFWKAGTPWYQLPATVAGTIVTFSITDGGLGDTDGLANGTIVDPSGAATSAPAAVGPVNPIPTMSEWALMILSVLLGLIVFANRKRFF